MLQRIQHYVINAYCNLFGFNAVTLLSAAKRFDNAIVAVQTTSIVPSGEQMRRGLWRRLLFEIWKAQISDVDLMPFMEEVCRHLEADKNDMLSSDDMMYIAEMLPGSLQKAASLPGLTTVPALRRMVHQRKLPRDVFAMSILAHMNPPDAKMQRFADITWDWAKKSPDGRVGIRA